MLSGVKINLTPYPGNPLLRLAKDNVQLLLQPQDIFLFIGLIVPGYKLQPLPHHQDTLLYLLLLFRAEQVKLADLFKFGPQARSGLDQANDVKFMLIEQIADG